MLDITLKGLVKLIPYDPRNVVPHPLLEDQVFDDAFWLRRREELSPLGINVEFLK